MLRDRIVMRLEHEERLDLGAGDEPANLAGPGSGLRSGASSNVASEAPLIWLERIVAAIRRDRPP